MERRKMKKERNKTKIALVRDRGLGNDNLDFSRAQLDRIKRLLEKGLSFMDGFLPSIRSKKVFIKPNLVRPNPVHNPSLSTDGRVILALCELALDQGASGVSIGDNPGYGLDFTQAIKESLIERELKKRKIGLLNIDKAPRKKVCNKKAMLFREYDMPVIEHDIFINLPKMKTHMHAMVSLSVKNLYGLVVDDQRLTFHREDLHRKLAELLYVHKPDMNIIDGLIPMEGQAPLYGRAVFGFNTLVMGRDIIGADTVASSIMGFDPEEISALRIAGSLGFGSIDIRDYEICGEKPGDVERRFARPVLSSAGVYDRVNSLEMGVCSGCLSGIRHSLDKLAFEGSLKDLKEEIVIVSGKPVQNMQVLNDFEGRIILYGNCAFGVQFYDSRRRNRAVLVPGCAPHIFDLYNAIKKGC